MVISWVVCVSNEQEVVWDSAKLNVVKSIKKKIIIIPTFCIISSVIRVLWSHHHLISRSVRLQETVCEMWCDVPSAVTASFGPGSMSMPAGFSNTAAYNLPTSFSGNFQQAFPGQGFPQPQAYAQQPNGSEEGSD